MRINSGWIMAAYLLLATSFDKVMTADDPSASIDLPRHAIVFAHHSDAARQDYDIWQIAADGTQMAAVVALPGRQTQFTISPDGKELIYVDPVNDKGDLWRRGFHGKNPVNLTSSDSNESSPQWSPDGGALLFSSDRDSEKREIYLMQLESGEVQRLTNNTLYDSEGTWAPDANRIIFTRFFPADDAAKSNGHGAIFELDLHTRQERQLTDLGGYSGGLNFSPDGQRITFHRVADDTAEIWVMDKDGQNQQQLTDTFIDEYSPAWSPDGNWIVFTAGTGHDGLGTFDLWLMRPDGSDRRLVSSAGNTQMSPQWRTGDELIR